MRLCERGNVTLLLEMDRHGSGGDTSTAQLSPALSGKAASFVSRVVHTGNTVLIQAPFTIRSRHKASASY